MIKEREQVIARLKLQLDQVKQGTEIKHKSSGDAREAAEILLKQTENERLKGELQEQKLYHDRKLKSLSLELGRVESSSKQTNNAFTIERENLHKKIESLQIKISSLESEKSHVDQNLQ